MCRRMVTLHKKNTAVGAPDDAASTDIAMADEAFTMANSIAKRANDAEENKCVADASPLGCSAGL